MKLRLITVGRIRSGPHQKIAEDYIKRLICHLPFECIPVKTEADLSKHIGKDDFLVVCDEGGQEMSSREFAGFIKERQVRSTRRLTFVIGPAEGLSTSVKKGADIRFAFSKLTIQHDLAMLVLIEQLYRACTIIRGGPYHK